MRVHAEQTVIVLLWSILQASATLVPRPIARAQRFEQMGRLIVRRPGELLAPQAQRPLHMMARCDELGDLPVNRLEHLFRGTTHVVTRFPALFADAEEGCNVAQRESELLGVSNERETIHDAVAVLPVARRSSRRHRQ